MDKNTNRANRTLYIALISMLFGACNIQNGMSNYDDIYFNPSVDEVRAKSNIRESETRQKRQPYSDTTFKSEPKRYEKEVKTISTEEMEKKTHKEVDGYEDSDLNDYDISPSAQHSSTRYEDEDDYYYDYAYAARLRRFHRPYYGWNYYDGFYTQSYFTYSPFYWGSGICFGYGWYPSYGYYPYYMTSIYSPYHYGYYSWGYSSPYYYWGYSPLYTYDHSRQDRNAISYRSTSISSGNGIDYNRPVSPQLSTNKDAQMSNRVVRTNETNVSSAYSGNLSRPSVATRQDSRDPSQTQTQNEGRSVVRLQKPDQRSYSRPHIEGDQRATRIYTPPSARQPGAYDEYNRPARRIESNTSGIRRNGGDYRPSSPSRGTTPAVNTRTERAAPVRVSTPSESRPVRTSEPSRSSSNSSSGRATRR